MFCEVALSELPFAAIYANLILYELLTIEIEQVPTAVTKLPPIASLTSRPFSLNLIDCVWFRKNTAEVMAHLRAHLSWSNAGKSRGLVLHGLKGSGKVYFDTSSLTSYLAP